MSRKSFMGITLYTLHCLLVLLLLGACSTAYHAHNQGIFKGKAALNTGNYAEAKQSFEDAYRQERTPEALMYLAIANYKMNNLDTAERQIREAEVMGSWDYHYLRVLGYKALILLKKDKNQGLEALGRYVAFYEYSDPLLSINDVREMLQTGNIDMSRLESLIEEQVSWFENDWELYWESGVGYHERRGAGGGPFRFQGGFIFQTR